MVSLLLLAALQQGVHAEPVLWRDLQAGMPKREVKSRYPKFKAELLPGCPVQVLSTYKKGGLRTVLLISPSTECAQRVRSDFARQYGEPTGGKVTEETSMPIAVGGFVSSTTYPRKDETWIVGPVRILFIALPGNGFNIVFSKASEGLVDSVR